MHVLGDGYTWSMQTVSSARDVHNRDRVIQSVILFFFFFFLHPPADGKK